MQNYFFAGNELVHWDVQLVRSKRASHVRLAVHHARGAIVEYFHSTEAALGRERELEDLLIAARSLGGSPPELAMAQ